MPKVLDLIAASRGRALWLDDTAYSERLLADGQTPWLEATAYVAFRHKAASLLRPDFAVVPVGAFASAWAAANPGLRVVMAARKRAVAPARVLLGDEGLRGLLVEVVRGLRAAHPHAPLVLALPSPRAWVVDAWRLAFGDADSVEAGADEADACAVYVAEFLRTFGEHGLDGLLLEESADAEPASAQEIAWYQPVINVAAHYRWALGLRLPSAQGFSGAVSGVQFVVAPRVMVGASTGLALDGGFWTGDAPPAAPADGFRFATVPADGVPEKVLQRLAVLRA
ncbi:MAG: hypothetical protein ACT4P0_01200 [Panacagrimonas sp.]